MLANIADRALTALAATPLGSVKVGVVLVPIPLASNPVIVANNDVMVDCWPLLLIIGKLLLIYATDSLSKSAFAVLLS